MAINKLSVISIFFLLIVSGCGGGSGGGSSGGAGSGGPGGNEHSGGVINFAWDANAEPVVAGYRVYYGTSPRTYGTSIDVGNVTTYTLDGLTVGGTYFVAVTAYSTSNEESDFSDEVSGIAQ